MPLIASYPICWYKDGVYWRHGNLRLWQGKHRQLMTISLENKYVAIPIQIVKFLIDNYYTSQINKPSTEQFKKLALNPKGIDLAFRNFKRGAHKTGVSSRYLLWKSKNGLEMTDSEKKQFAYRLKKGSYGMAELIEEEAKKQKV